MNIKVIQTGITLEILVMSSIIPSLKKKNLFTSVQTIGTKVYFKNPCDLHFSQKTVTLNKSQGHQNWYQNVELSGTYHHTKFEKNRSVFVWIQANVYVLFFFTDSHEKDSLPWMLNARDKMSMTMRFPTPTPTNLKSFPSSIQMKSIGIFVG